MVIVKKINKLRCISCCESFPFHECCFFQVFFVCLRCFKMIIWLSYLETYADSYDPLTPFFPAKQVRQTRETDLQHVLHQVQASASNPSPQVGYLRVEVIFKCDPGMTFGVFYG